MLSTQKLQDPHVHTLYWQTSSPQPPVTWQCSVLPGAPDGSPQAAAKFVVAASSNVRDRNTRFNIPAVFLI
jgi:hypothetical protein